MDIGGEMLHVRRGLMYGQIVLQRGSRPKSQVEVAEAMVEEKVVAMVLTISGRREMA
jgi:hypothetical protein